MRSGRCFDRKVTPEWLVWLCNGNSANDVLTCRIEMANFFLQAETAFQAASGRSPKIRSPSSEQDLSGILLDYPTFTSLEEMERTYASAVQRLYQSTTYAMEAAAYFAILDIVAFGLIIRSHGIVKTGQAVSNVLLGRLERMGCAAKDGAVNYAVESTIQVIQAIALAMQLDVLLEFARSIPVICVFDSAAKRLFGHNYIYAFCRKLVRVALFFGSIIQVMLLELACHVIWLTLRAILKCVIGQPRKEDTRGRRRASKRSKAVMGAVQSQEQSQPSYRTQLHHLLVLLVCLFSIPIAFASFYFQQEAYGDVTETTIDDDDEVSSSDGLRMENANPPHSPQSRPLEPGPKHSPDTLPAQDSSSDGDKGTERAIDPANTEEKVEESVDEAHPSEPVEPPLIDTKTPGNCEELEETVVPSAVGLDPGHIGGEDTEKLAVVATVDAVLSTNTELLEEAGGSDPGAVDKGVGPDQGLSSDGETKSDVVVKGDVRLVDKGVGPDPGHVSDEEMDKAVVVARKAGNLMDKAVGPDQSDVGDEEMEKAVVLARRDVGLVDKAVGPDHAHVSDEDLKMAVVVARDVKLVDKAVGPDLSHLEEGEKKEAVVVANKGRQLVDKAVGPDLSHLEEEKEAVVVANKGRQLVDKAVGPDQSLVEETQKAVMIARKNVQSEARVGEVESDSLFDIQPSTTGPLDIEEDLEKALVAFSKQISMEAEARLAAGRRALAECPIQMEPLNGDSDTEDKLEQEVKREVVESIKPRHDRRREVLQIRKEAMEQYWRGELFSDQDSLISEEESVFIQQDAAVQQVQSTFLAGRFHTNTPKVEPNACLASVPIMTIGMLLAMLQSDVSENATLRTATNVATTDKKISPKESSPVGGKLIPDDGKRQDNKSQMVVPVVAVTNEEPSETKKKTRTRVRKRRSQTLPSESPIATSSTSTIVEKGESPGAQSDVTVRDNTKRPGQLGHSDFNDSLTEVSNMLIPKDEDLYSPVPQIVQKREPVPETKQKAPTTTTQPVLSERQRSKAPAKPSRPGPAASSKPKTIPYQIPARRASTSEASSRANTPSSTVPTALSDIISPLPSSSSIHSITIAMKKLSLDAPPFVPASARNPPSVPAPAAAATTVPGSVPVTAEIGTLAATAPPFVPKSANVSSVAGSLSAADRTSGSPVIPKRKLSVEATPQPVPFGVGMSNRPPSDLWSPAPKVSVSICPPPPKKRRVRGRGRKALDAVASAAMTSMNDQNAAPSSRAMDIINF